MSIRDDALDALMEIANREKEKNVIGVDKQNELVKIDLNIGKFIRFNIFEPMKTFSEGISQFSISAIEIEEVFKETNEIFGEKFYTEKVPTSEEVRKIIWYP